MVSRPALPSLLAVLCVVGPVASQQPPKVRNPIEERLKAGRLEPPGTVDSGKFSQMRNGNIALEKPTDPERAILEGKAQQLIYPVTHFEYYSTTEAPNAELTPRVEDKTVAKLLADLKSQLVVITPGDTSIPAPKIDFAREFGAAAVKAVDEVLKKGPQPVVRMNVIRMLGVIAESGAPAATERITTLLREKDKALPVEALYATLKAAEQAIGMYDPARSAVSQKWVTKDAYFELVCLVDDVVQKVPASVALSTYQPERPGTATLTTDPKAPPKPAPTQLTAEQVGTVQAYRLQAVRALARVKTDAVSNANGDKKRRTAYTLARIAVSDTTLVPPPSPREVIEAVGGLATAAPVDPELDPLVLGVAMATGVKEFVIDKVPSGSGTSPQVQLWKLTGARMKSTFQAWNTTVTKSKLDKSGKDVLTEFAQIAISQVFDPLSKQYDKPTDIGIVDGLNKEAVDKWLTTRSAEVKAMQLYKDTDRAKDSGTSKLNPK